MKRILNGLGAALCACALLAATGCGSIRDYSVNSYYGVMPAGDLRPAGYVAPAPPAEVVPESAARTK